MYVYIYIYTCFLLGYSPLNMNTHLLIDSYPYTVKLLYLAFLYLAESVILMPSPRNHILDVFNLAAALSGNGQSAKSKFFTTSTSLIPKFKIRLRQWSNFEFRTLLATIAS